MPPKKCCKKCANKQEPYICFKKGIKVGFGIASTPPLSKMTLRELGFQASKLGIPNYSKMTKAQLVQALREAGYRNQK